jgi:hypothetical protein
MSKMLIETQWNVWKWRDKLLLFTGARPNEITHAKGEYINWDHGISTPICAAAASPAIVDIRQIIAPLNPSN